MNNISLSFSRSILRHIKCANDTWSTSRTPYFNNVSLNIDGNNVYVLGSRGRKYITVKESPRGVGAPLLGLRGKYTVVVGGIYPRQSGLEALATFLFDDKRNDVLENLLEMIVFRIAKTAQIDEPDVYISEALF